MTAKVTLQIENGDAGSLLGALFGRNAAPAMAAPANAATLSFGTLTTQVPVEAGDSVARLFAKGSRDLGMEAGRALTFQNKSGQVIPADSKAVVGESYMAAPNHDPKG